MNFLASLAHPTAPPLHVGDGHPVRVMALVGSTSKADEKKEAEKVLLLCRHSAAPDIIADLSLRISNHPIWRQVLEAGFVTATLPIYTTSRVNKRIDPAALLDRAVEHLEGGVGMITIHPTARRDIIDLARRRYVPWTSRGGGLVIEDLLSQPAEDNVYLKILPDLAATARRRGATISLGATFRSGTTADADDDAQRAEISFQAELAKQLRSTGCSVIIEGPGHSPPRSIPSLASRMRLAGCPIMPLGPIPTDLAVGQDHISAAIGAALMGLAGAAHILAAVTREEHTGGVPNLSSTLEAVDAARVAAYVIDSGRQELALAEKQIAESRSLSRTCVSGRTLPGCSRCGSACPL